MYYFLKVFSYYVGSRKKIYLQAMKAMQAVFEDIYGRQVTDVHSYGIATELFKALAVHVAEGNVVAALKNITAKNMKAVKGVIAKEQATVMKSGGLLTDFQCGIAKEMGRVHKL